MGGKIIKKYLTAWWFLTKLTTQAAFESRFGAIVFLIGKLLRFAFFLLFLYLLVSHTKALAGYNLWQVLFFFATFNLVDAIPQFFLREVYRFRQQVVSGNFDFVLTRPLSPLFRSLLGGSDVLDLSIMMLSAAMLIFSATKIGGITLLSTATFLILLTGALLLALAFHILVLGIGILTTEVDNTILLYRDLTQMGRVPVDIYREPVRSIITFVIPVGIMMTFPAKALMGLLSAQFIAISLGVSLGLFYLALRFWDYSLKHYQSASS